MEKEEWLDMEKIRLHYLIGDVHMGGHDVHRIAGNNKALLDRAGIFEVTMVCDDPGLGDLDFDTYFAGDGMENCDVIVFNCGNYRFNTKEEQERMERAVAGGTGLVFLHGEHPSYWPAAGNVRWEGLEKMAGLFWRESTSHGDYHTFEVKMERKEHPITRGLTDFITKDELFCHLENPQGVPFEVLAGAYSDPEIISRHGLPGTGAVEPTAVILNYGKGRVYNQILGHVWPYYTGHGLGENTMLSFAPEQFRTMFVRGCEWAATGKTEGTKHFNGKIKLR